MGVILYAMVTGKLPFLADTAEATKELVGRLLPGNPSRPPPSDPCGTVLDAAGGVHSLRGSDPPAAAPGPTGGPGERRGGLPRGTEEGLRSESRWRPHCIIPSSCPI